MVKPGLRYDVIHQHNSPFKFKILCQACFPKDAIYHDCHIYNVAAETFLIANQHGFATGHDGGDIVLSRGRRSAESLTWFSWRIVAPPTKAYWETVGDISNCRGEEELLASMVLWSTITHTTLGLWGQAEREQGGFLAISLLEVGWGWAMARRAMVNNVKDSPFFYLELLGFRHFTVVLEVLLAYFEVLQSIC